MHLSILTQYYPPETGAPQNRLHDFAVRMVERGHQVQVLTALPNYPGGAIYPGYSGRRIVVEKMDGIRVVRVGLFVSKRRSFTRQVLTYITFALNARWGGHFLLEKSDLILMESPPLFVSYAGVRLAEHFKAKLVVNISDLWPQAIVDLGKLQPGISLSAARALETWMYRNADLVTGQTEDIIRNIQLRFPNVKTQLFPNGVDLSRYAHAEDREIVRRRYRWADDTFVVGYTGIFGHSQAFWQVIEAARIIESNNQRKILIALFGDGPMKEELSASIERIGLRNLRIYPHQATDRMPGIQQSFNVGLVPLARGRVFEGARPSKMFEYMAASLPIVLCAKGEAIEVMEGPGHRCGIAVPPESPLALANALIWLAENRDTAVQMGKRGYWGVCEHFDRAKIALELETILLQCIMKDL